MISCKQAVARLWEYLDGHVDAEDRAALEAHLALCRRCCGELEFAQELRAFLVRAGQGEDVPPDVMTRLDQMLEELER